VNGAPASPHQVGDPAVLGRIRVALETILDPCSRATDVPLSVLDMGLVRSVVAGPDGAVGIVMTTTGPVCTLVPVLAEGVHDAVRAVPGVQSVEVTFDSGYLWTPASMSERARQAREEWHDQQVRRLDLRPRQWRRQAGQP
jgi:metal-sulfur cluster biosynthetic enzyme